MSDALENAVAGQLEKLNSGSDWNDSTSDEPEEVVDTSTDDDSTESSTNEPKEEGKLIDNVDDTEDISSSDEINDDNNDDITADNELAIPESYMRAAIHQGWTEEEVKGFWEADEEKAEKTLSKILESTNRLSNQWSQLGQQQMTLSSPTDPPTKKIESVTKDSNISFTGLDISKLKTDYDDEGLINDVVKPLNDLLIQMNSKLESVESQQIKTLQDNEIKQTVANTEKSTVIGQQIDQFFGSIKLEKFKEFYGTGSDWTKFEGGQADNRMKLLTLADQIKTGAAYQNKEIDNEAAMNLAHLSLTASLTEQTIIEDLKKSLTKREKGISLKPSGSRASSVSDNKSDKSGKNTEKIVGDFMKKRGIKQY